MGARLAPLQDGLLPERSRGAFLRRHSLPAVAATAAVLTLLGTLLLAAGIRTVQALPHYFWPIVSRFRPDFVVVGLTLLVAGAGAVWALDSRRSARRRVTGAVVAFLALEYGMAFAEGRGVEGLRDRALLSGHAEFAVTASRPESWWTVLRDYESYVQSADLPYARSKPPGQLLLYAGAGKIAHWVMPRLWNSPPARPELVRSARHLELVNFLTLFLPLLASLTLWPLFRLGEIFGGKEVGVYAALLFAFVPQVVLVQLHFDQALYPLLATMQALLTVRAFTAPARRLAWAAAAGATHWLACFVSFSLLPAVAFSVVLALSVALPGKAPNRRELLAALGVLTGTVGLLAASFYGAFDYNPVIAYRRALAHHIGFKRWTDAMRWECAGLGFAELFYWAGAGLGLLFLVGVTRALWRGRRGHLDTPAWAALGVLAVLLATALMGRTVGEFARLWLFMIPSVALVAAMTLQLCGPPRRWLLAALLACQATWIVSLKLLQDFW